MWLKLQPRHGGWLETGGRVQVSISREQEADVCSLPEERGMNYHHGRLSLLLTHGGPQGADGLLALGGLESRYTLHQESTPDLGEG